eukprot:gene16704-16883_t
MSAIPNESHEAVYRLDRPDLGFSGFIALHSTVLGPAFGGTRVWSYQNEDQALLDALRLSEGMTYKNALADLNVGGGKAVLWIKDPSVPREAIFSAFGEAVESLHGRYMTAEDVGTSVKDMQIIRTVTRHVAGLPPVGGQAGGDPSPWTALGVFCAIDAALKSRGKTVQGSTIAVQGCGHVGESLCALLCAAGAFLKVSDIRTERAKSMAQAYGAQICNPDTILSTTADVLAPCSLGAGLNQQTIPYINAKIIVGAANNQLATQQDGLDLHNRGILYVPDYVVNAGGIISAVAEAQGDKVQFVEGRVRAIGARVSALLRQSEQLNRAPFQLADEMAKAILNEAILENVAHRALA